MMTLLYIVIALGVIIFWLVVVVMAALGRSLGVTKLYIRILLFIFQVSPFRMAALCHLLYLLLTTRSPESIVVCKRELNCAQGINGLDAHRHYSWEQ